MEIVKTHTCENHKIVVSKETIGQFTHTVIDIVKKS